jgi:hypothetical protein
MQVPRNTSGVIGVGAGLGFVLEVRGNRYVVTAAHCLPQLPEPNPDNDEINELTYENLIGRLGEIPDVSAQCVFIDPVNDVAVLEEPENQELYQQKEAFAVLTQEADAFQLGLLADTFQLGLLKDVSTLRKAFEDRWSPGLMLSLDRRWTECQMERRGYRVQLSEETQPGTAGSPILNVTGEAVSLVAAGTGDDGGGRISSRQRALSDVLPHWLVAAAWGN